MLFSKYFPNAKFTYKFLIPEIVTELSPNKKLCMEVATARGMNLRRFIRAGWQGKLVGYDLWEPQDLQPNIAQAELIRGNVLDTLIPSYNGDPIDVLFLDLDGDPVATPFTLEVLTQGLKNSLIFVDEFHNFDQWQTKDCVVIARWLEAHNIPFDILYYTKYGALIQTGTGYPPHYLLECLSSTSS